MYPDQCHGQPDTRFEPSTSLSSVLGPSSLSILNTSSRYLSPEFSKLKVTRFLID